MGKRPAKLKVVTSAGGVIYRMRNNAVEVALIKLGNGTVFTLPKGMVDRGESIAETAVREVKEETGLSGRIRKELGSVTYWFYMKEENRKYKKTVHYFLMEYTGGVTEDHEREVEDAIWFAMDEAISKVSYKGDKEILGKAKSEVMG